MFFLFSLSMFCQEENVVKDYYKENFVVRAFDYSKQHYFARLSYNNQTIYTTNRLHPSKRIIILSNTNNGVKTLAFSNDENFLISGTITGKLEVWDINKRTLVKTISLHNKAINKLKFLSQEAFFISAGNDGKIFLVDFQETQKSKLIGNHEGIVRDFDVSDDNSFLVSIGSDNKLIIWDLNEFKKIKSTIIRSARPTSVKFVPNSKSILVGDSMGNLLLLDGNLDVTNKINIHKDILSKICAFSENIIYTSSFDGSIKKIDLKDFKLKNVYSNKSYIINMVIKDDILTFSNRNGELISKKIEPK